VPAINHFNVIHTAVEGVGSMEGKKKQSEE
jgi:hypothetical protein